LWKGIGFGVLVICYIRVTLWIQTSHRQAFKIRVALLKAILRQEIGWFDVNDAGELGTRLVE
jgi:ATP-binding cassette subfamily B (MDR/TAP) protein 1